MATKKPAAKGKAKVVDIKSAPKKIDPKTAKVAQATSVLPKETIAMVTETATKSALAELNAKHDEIMDKSEKQLKASAKVLKEVKVAAKKPAAVKKMPPKKAPAKKVTGLQGETPQVELPKRISTKGLLNSDVPKVEVKKPAPWETASPSPSVVAAAQQVIPSAWPTTNPAAAPVPPVANDALVEQKANAPVPQGRSISFAQLQGGQAVQPANVLPKEKDGSISFATFMKG